MTTRPYPATIRGVAAVWLLRWAEREIADAAGYQERVMGRPGIAAEMRHAVDELRQAARSHQDLEAARMSADGRADGPLGEEPSESGHDDELEVPDVAALMGVTERHVRRLLAGDLLIGRKVGRSWLCIRSAVDDYLEAHGRAAA